MSEKKQKKTARWDMRVVPDLDSRAKEMAEQLGMSRNVFVEKVVYSAVLMPEKFFVLCPTCKVPMFEVESIPIWEGTSEIKCHNGHVHEFDFETEKFVSK